jgi:hypothetical protein
MKKLTKYFGMIFILFILSTLNVCAYQNQLRDDKNIVDNTIFLDDLEINFNPIIYQKGIFKGRDFGVLTTITNNKEINTDVYWKLIIYRGWKLAFDDWDSLKILDEQQDSIYIEQGQTLDVVSFTSNLIKKVLPFKSLTIRFIASEDEFFTSTIESSITVFSIYYKILGFFIPDYLGIMSFYEIYD